MSDEKEEAAPRWIYAMWGAAIGVAAGVVIGRALERREGEEGEGPGLAARILRRIPNRVKMAGAWGAAKGASAEAWREIREKLTHGLRGNGAVHEPEPPPSRP